MTRDDLAKMAREADCHEYTFRHAIDEPAFSFSLDRLERFANLVVEKYKNDIFGLIGVDDWIEAKPILFPTTESLIAEAVAKEREACAELLLRIAGDTPSLAAMIRARGRK